MSNLLNYSEFFKMYYLSKFCRICIQTGVKLMDINTLDFDSVKLSEKLEACSKTVLEKANLSTNICIQCITKLRISYQFQDMCKNSNKILEAYLAELIGTSDKNNLENFINTDLSVNVTPLSNYSTDQFKRKRITKEQRCSLLKQLLTPNKKIKERDKVDVNTPLGGRKKKLKNVRLRGGLRNIINFTQNYEFGCNLSEATPLDKLMAFSDDFFKKGFTEFKNIVLYIIENKDNICDSDDDSDDIFNPIEVKDVDVIKFEEVIVEPDIKVKSEIVFEDENDEQYNFLESTPAYECKTEVDVDSTTYDFHSYNSLDMNVCDKYGHHSPLFNTYHQETAVQLLDNLVETYSYGHRRTFSQNSVRCRTRNNPYINPLLKEQFLFRSFQCEKCNRYFKSPGYLKAHNSKVH